MPYGYMCAIMEVRGQHQVLFPNGVLIIRDRVIFIDLKFTGSVCVCCPSTRIANKEPLHQLTWVLRTELKSSAC